jgi:hypothetical protein
MLGSSLAARWVARWGVSCASQIAALLAAAGLWGVSQWTAQPQFAWMLGCLILQGFGLGLYQVAYTDQVLATLPIHERGVAGSLSMVTRTIGVIVGASVLTGLLHAGMPAAGQMSGQIAGQMAGQESASPAAFVEAFGGVFRLAAASVSALFVLRVVWALRQADLKHPDETR